MRFLIFSFDYLPNTGGIARMMSSIEMGLSKAGQGVKVLTAYNGEIKAANITQLKHKRGLQELYALLYLVVNPTDIILCGRWYPEGLIAWLSRKNYVVFTHSAELLPLQKTGVLNTLREKIKSIVLSKAKNVVANSTFTQSLNNTSNGITIPLAVNENLFRPISISEKQQNAQLDELILLSVSRIQEHKGHAVVLHAIAQLPKEVKENIKYKIAGTGTHRKPLEKLVIKLGLINQVEWLGFVPEEDLEALYQSASLFLLCSTSEVESRRIEGFGLSLLEAQACGIPVIGALSGGIPSAIDHENGGYLVPEGDSNVLANKITELFNSPSLLQTQGQKARQRVESECTWDQYTERLMQLLDT